MPSSTWAYFSNSGASTSRTGLTTIPHARGASYGLSDRPEQERRAVHCLCRPRACRPHAPTRL